MIGKDLVERIYSAASIQRWNDHVRPVEFSELDKQSHKMIFAYVLAKFEEERGPQGRVDWTRLIEGGIFEFLQRIMLTDIKPEIFHEMMSKKGEELNRWVAEGLQDEIAPIGGGFREAFDRYFFDPGYAEKEKKILRAAHYLSTRWEFRIIANFNTGLYGIEKTKDEIESQIEDYVDLIGVRKIELEKRYYGFLDLCGQLRFQQRWAQSPRLPRTSVLGHMLVVALLVYFVSRDMRWCPRRLYNNFLSSLFHDLPEVLTRDIISPIKRSVKGLDEILKMYEGKQLDEKILPLLPDAWHGEMRYFVANEFSNRIVKSGRVELLSGEIGAAFNEDRFSPIDGELVRVCDKLAAYIEASLSIRYGITSAPLIRGRDDTYADYHDKVVNGYDFRPLFDKFR